MAGTRSGGRAAWWALAAGLMAWTACAASMDNGLVGVVHDDGIYLATARSLRDGEGFRLPSRPGQPPSKYPIGLPGLIAVASALVPGPKSLGSEVAVGRAIVIASGVATAVGIAVWLRRVGVRPWAATAIALATVFHHVALIGGATTIFADLPFATVAFALLARWRRPDPSGLGRTPAESFVDGVLAAAGFLIRGNGVTLVAGSLLAAWLSGRRRAALFACLAGLALAIVPAKLGFPKPARAVPSGDYRLEMEAGWSSPGAGARVVAKNLQAVAVDFPARVLLPNATYTNAVARWLDVTPGAGLVARGGATLLAALGLLSLARTSRRVDLPAWLHGAGTLAIFAVWPWASIMDRFLLPLFPIVLLGAGRGASAIAGKVGAGTSARRRAAGLTLALALVGNLGVAARAVVLFHAEGRQWPGATRRASLTAALAFLRDRTEPDAVAAAHWPEVVYLHAGRQGVPLTEDDDVMLRRYGRIERLRLWLDQIPGRPFYLLLRLGAEDPDAVDARQAGAVAADPRLAIREVFRTPDGRYAVSKVDRRP